MSLPLSTPIRLFALLPKEFFFVTIYKNEGGKKEEEEFQSDFYLTHRGMSSTLFVCMYSFVRMPMRRRFFISFCWLPFVALAIIWKYFHAFSFLWIHKYSEWKKRKEEERKFYTSFQLLLCSFLLKLFFLIPVRIDEYFVKGNGKFVKATIFFCVECCMDFIYWIDWKDLKKVDKLNEQM